MYYHKKVLDERIDSIEPHDIRYTILRKDATIPRVIVDRIFEKHKDALIEDLKKGTHSDVTTTITYGGYIMEYRKLMIDICINKDINLVGSDDVFSVIDNKGKVVIIIDFFVNVSFVSVLSFYGNKWRIKLLDGCTIFCVEIRMALGRGTPFSVTAENRGSIKIFSKILPKSIAFSFDM